MAKQMVTWVYPAKEGNDAKISTHLEDFPTGKGKGFLEFAIGIESIILNGVEYYTRPISKLYRAVPMPDGRNNWYTLGMYQFEDSKELLHYGIVGTSTQSSSLGRIRIGIMHPTAGLERGPHYKFTEPQIITLSTRQIVKNLEGGSYFVEYNELFKDFETYSETPVHRRGVAFSKHFETGSFGDEREMGNNEISRNFDVRD